MRGLETAARLFKNLQAFRQLRAGAELGGHGGQQVVFGDAGGLSDAAGPLGQRVAGIYRRSIMLASGRYVMLDDGMGFSLVPWKHVIEQRVGQQMAATMRGSGVSWDIGRARSPSIG